MKVISMLVLLALTAHISVAQTYSGGEKDNFRRRGFVGVTFGPSIPIGQFSYASHPGGGAKVGTHANLLNFGYRFNERVGIAAKFYTAAHPVKYIEFWSNWEEFYEPWAYNGLMVGPLFSFPLNPQLELDFRPMMGYTIGELPQHKESPVEHKSKVAVAYSLGVNLQYNAFRRIGFHAGLDLYHSSPRFTSDYNPITVDIITLTPSLGVVYRFK